MAGPLYNQRRWRRPRTGLRDQILARDNYCCTRCGRVELASRLHAHHKTPHRNNPQLFWNPSNLVTLCETCHNEQATPAERLGYSTELGSDGLPVDGAHPFNRR
jgi:5-methylcytosine-specific restriction enzyme A